MRRWLQLIFLLSAPAFAYASAPAFALPDLIPGAHHLTASATTPNGFFTTNASVWFTNSATHQTAALWRDNAGNVTEEIWLNANGSTNRVDQMWWDARERLYMMAETLGDGSGYLWFADYDGLNRRVRTHWNYTTNGIIYLNPKGYVEVDSQYDPEVEFLELGVTVNGQQTFKVCGPDLDGRYGGMNGTGGFDATVANPLQDFSPTITDSRGDILGEVTNGVVNWFSTRPTAYGAVPGYRPVPLGMGGDLAQSAAWRGRPAELNGWVNLGTRLYDPEAGMFVSYDSGWNDLDPGSVSFSAGDPENYFDPAGRIGKNGNAALSGDYLVLDQNFRPVGSYSAYDAYYLGGQAQAMRFSLRHNPLLGAEMGADAPVNAFGGRSFRMVFGNEAAGFADFALNMDTAPLGMLNEVALSSHAAGTASVTGQNRGFAYTRATVAILSTGMMLEEPAQGLVDEGATRTVPDVERTGTQQEFDFVRGLGPAPKPVYPPNNGFFESSGTATLVPGARIDRFGSDFGRFASPEGTPFIQRSLPSFSASAPYSVFEVVKPFEVKAGEITPWFGMPGRGVQYQFSVPINQLIKEGYLRPVLRVNP